MQIPADPAQSALNSPGQSNALPNLDPGVLPAESERQKAEEQVKSEEKQRILGIMPQFNVSNLADAVPLTPEESLSWHSNLRSIHLPSWLPE
jgi:hypothetical protein